MRRCLNKPDAIPAKPYVAFLSLSYNFGTSAFCRSTVVKRANAGDVKGACGAISMWDRADGKRVCSSAIVSSSAIRPDLDELRFLEIVSTPVGENINT